MDYASEILDEIALEGLDGITIDGIWLRLTERPNFSCSENLDYETKCFLWNFIRRLRDVEFYLLEEPRKPLEHFNRYYIDPELGIVTETNPPPEDLYPHHLVNDVAKNVIGSCATYETRKNITSKVRKLQLSAVYSTFGDRLVIVANQYVRKRTLVGINTNPNLEISPIQFCILERIGRSRYHGESTQGKNGLQAIGEDTKSIFYLRKYLLKQNLITKQTFHQKTISNNVTGLLLHLPRFYNIVKPKYVTLTENVIRFLKDQPNCIAEYGLLRDHLIVPGVLKKLTKVAEFLKYVRTDVKVPYRTLYPDADIKQWRHKASDRERKIRILQLRDPDIDVRDLRKKLLSDLQDDEEEDVVVDNSKINSGLMSEHNRYIDLPIFSQCCLLLKKVGSAGLSQTEMAKELGFSKVQARTITKNLVKTGAAGSFMTDVGRQRVAKFYLKHIDDDNDINLNLNSSLILNDNPILMTKKLMNDTSRPSSSAGNSILNNLLDISNDDFKSIKYEPSSNLNSANNDDGISLFDSSTSYNTTLHSIDETTMLNSSTLQDDDTTKDSERTSVSNDTNYVEDPVDNHKDTINNNNNKRVNNFVDDLNVDIVNKKPKLLTDDDSTSNIIDNDNNSTDKNESNVTENQMNIDVSITNNYDWLLPDDRFKKGILKLKQSNQIACSSLKTSRLLKRSNIILETVKEFKVINDVRKFVLIINEAEYKEGLPNRMDKKSLLRILFKLAVDEHIKVYRVTLKSNNDVSHLNFICEMNIEPDHPIIKSSIEFAKLKFYSSIEKSKCVSDANYLNRGNNKRSINLYDQRGHNGPQNPMYPKFNRMKVLHRFLYYLVYDYKGQEFNDQDEVRNIIDKEYKLNKDIIDLMPPIYSTKVDWKMFVPPLPKYCNDEENSGWCLMSDILIRLPLSVFVQLIYIPYFIPELESFLNHPIKRHILVSKLPIKLRNCLTVGRKYIFTIFDAMTKLSYIGLLQFGPHQNKEKEQIFTYVNQNTMLLDTTLTKQSYNKISPDIEYPVQKYKFTMLTDVDEYWHDAWKICMNTQLGGRILAEEVIIENVQDKQEMIDAIKARDFADASKYDNGNVPGDKLGAAGYDSALFAHLKRNWHSKTSRNNVMKLTANSFTSNDNHKKSQQNTASTNKLKRKSSESHNNHNNNNNLIQKSMAKQMKLSSCGTSSMIRDKSNLVVIPINKKSRIRKPIIRRINPKKKALHRKPFYDQIDKEALKRMSKLRVDWSQEEDRLLLICKIASAFICPQTRRQINANMFLAFREVLHKTFQQSRNKTSRACQRRVHYMLRSENINHNVNLCIEELRQDSNTMKRFGNVLKMIENEAESSGKKIKEMESVWKSHFKELVEYLVGRYNLTSNNNLSFTIINNQLSDNDFTLPDTLNDFYNDFNVVYLKKKQSNSKDLFFPIDSLSDIYSAVINITIHSTLCCNSDKTSWSYHLFSIYQQYPEKLLRDVLSKLRETQMVSFKKTYQVRNKTSNNYLPLSASPYQLSITYVNLIQTKYQFDLFSDCYENFGEIVKNCKSCDDKGYNVVSLTGGSTAAIVQLFNDDIVSFNINIPNQIVVLDPDVKNKDETYSRLVQRYQDILTTYKKDLTTSVLFQKHNYASGSSSMIDEESTSNDVTSKLIDESVSMNEDVNKTPEIMTNSRALYNVAKAASRLALYLMRDDLDKSSVGLVPKEMDHAHDFFVVNSCDIYVKIIKNDIFNDNDSTVLKKYNIVDNQMIKLILETIRGSSIFNDDSIINLEINGVDKLIRENFDSDFDLTKSLLTIIESKKEFGLTNEELIEKFSDNIQLIADILKKLIKLSLILSTGVVSTRFVHYTYVRPWLLYSYRNTRSEKDARVPMKNLECIKLAKDDNDGDKDSSVNASTSEETKSLQSVEEYMKDIQTNITASLVGDNRDNLNKQWNIENENYKKLINHNMSHPIKVVMRPWIRVDGSLNRRVLDAMLSSVLGHIMLYPGVSLYDIQQRFLPAYQPRHIHELCDILVELNCVYRYTVSTKLKPTLFSKPAQIIIDDSPTNLEAVSELRFESSKFAIFNLGKFFSTKQYTQDFVSSLLGK